MPNCRAVVTGVGLATPIGKEPDEVWNHFLSNTNGIKELGDTYQELEQYGISIAGLFPDVDGELSKLCAGLGKKTIYRKYNKRDRVLLYCTLKAILDSGLRQDEWNKMSAIIGTGMDFTDIFEPDSAPTKFFNSYPNILISHLAQYIPLEYEALTIVDACCSGLQAMGEGFRKIRSGAQKIVLAGGIDDKLNPFCARGFSRLGMVTKSGDKDSAMRPFDKERSGFVMGQGGAVFILEEYEHAKERNASIFGEIVGYGSSLEVTSIADASVEGKQRAMENAILDAGISYQDIGFVNTHGTSTVSNDRAESIAINNVFQEHTKELIVNSTKSFIGHTFAACGPIQSFVCMKSLSNLQTHGNLHFEQGEMEHVFTIPKESVKLGETEYCITNTSAVGGINASLVFKRF